jgi:hypothetical protein
MKPRKSEEKNQLDQLSVLEKALESEKVGPNSGSIFTFSKSSSVENNEAKKGSFDSEKCEPPAQELPGPPSLLPQMSLSLLCHGSLIQKGSKSVVQSVKCFSSFVT